MQNILVEVNVWPGVTIILSLYTKWHPTLLIPLLTPDIGHKSVTCGQRYDVKVLRKTISQSLIMTMYLLYPQWDGLSYILKGVAQGYWIHCLMWDIKCLFRCRLILVWLALCNWPSYHCCYYRVYAIYHQQMLATTWKVLLQYRIDLELYNNLYYIL